MSTRTERDEPGYFGPGQDLFGIYHPGCLGGRQAALLCPPLGQDLIRCHRLYRQLARALASLGLAVLRFDYHGTGDSAGATGEVDWSRCLADVATAAGQLRLRSGCEQVIGFGARLGGSLALAAADRAQFAELILWDPVLDGPGHVAALDALQSALRLDGNRFVAPRPAAALADQWQGFAIGDGLRQPLAGLRLDPPRRRTLLVCSSAADGNADHHRFAAAGAEVAALSQPTPWQDLAHLETAIQSHELIDIVGRRVQEATYA
ncbi:serine aminopeptidase domain-containing protein [Frateuria hangzhouensis]|uniref:serine aminopeptidase domain-containing protein n=1 Tax=Frateuria hangzhouensis TaxID=2995589 RepID=UPI002260D2DC|nr:alpha/beta hydrolase [Frateuria sp. STR12]MCX7514594.1 alpha/beta fold hydrolase [Frateuria sp. STR12]